VTPARPRLTCKDLPVPADSSSEPDAASARPTGAARSAPPAAPLGQLVREMERYVASGGWDQPTRLFALVDPSLDEVAVARPPADGTGAWAALEQSALPPHDDPVTLLARLEWPDEVTGAVIALETVMAGRDRALPADPVAAREAAARDPGRQEARLVVAVLADGTAASALRWRAHDQDEDVSTGTDLVPVMTEALRSTLRRSF
jgi:hypothetical protein